MLKMCRRPHRCRRDVASALPAPTAAKLEIYRAMRAEGLGAEQLAQRLGWEPAQVTRLFGRRATRLDHIEAALRVLGRRLVVTSEAAERLARDESARNTPLRPLGGEGGAPARQRGGG
jgi:hypothetical protein